MAFIRNPDDQESVTPVLGGQSSVVDTTQPAQMFSRVNNYLNQAQPAAKNVYDPVKQQPVAPPAPGPIIKNLPGNPTLPKDVWNPPKSVQPAPSPVAPPTTGDPWTPIKSLPMPAPGQPANPDQWWYDEIGKSPWRNNKDYDAWSKEKWGPGPGLGRVQTNDYRGLGEAWREADWYNQYAQEKGLPTWSPDSLLKMLKDRNVDIHNSGIGGIKYYPPGGPPVRQPQPAPLKRAPVSPIQKAPVIPSPGQVLTGPIFGGNPPNAPAYISDQTSPYANIMNNWEKALQTQINTPPNAEHFAASDKIKDLNDQLYGLGKYATTGAVTQGQQEYWNQKNAAAPWNVQVPGYVPAAPLQKTPDEQARDDMFLQSVRTESDRLNAQRQAAIDYANTHKQEIADRDAMFLQSVRDSSDRDNAIRQLAIDRYNQANPNSKI